MQRNIIWGQVISGHNTTTTTTTTSTTSTTSTTTKAEPITNTGISRAMELLSSIKKQRELFSETLTTAQMPISQGGKAVIMEKKQDNNNDTATSRTKDVRRRLSFNLDPVEETSDETEPTTPRKPLSPRNKKGGMNDARQLVSCLRTKREDMIKRFEQANLTNKPRTTTTTTTTTTPAPTPTATATTKRNDHEDDNGNDQENDFFGGRLKKKKPVVDLTLLNHHHRRTSSLDTTTVGANNNKLSELESVVRQIKSKAPSNNTEMEITTSVAEQEQQPQKGKKGSEPPSSLSSSSSSSGLVENNRFPRGNDSAATGVATTTTTTVTRPVVVAVAGASSPKPTKKIVDASWIKPPEKEEATANNNSNTNPTTKAINNTKKPASSSIMQNSPDSSRKAPLPPSEGRNFLAALPPKPSSSQNDTAWIKKNNKDEMTSSSSSSSSSSATTVDDGSWIKKTKSSSFLEDTSSASVTSSIRRSSSSVDSSWIKKGDEQQQPAEENVDAPIVVGVAAANNTNNIPIKCDKGEQQQQQQNKNDTDSCLKQPSSSIVSSAAATATAARTTTTPTTTLMVSDIVGNRRSLFEPSAALAEKGSKTTKKQSNNTISNNNKGCLVSSSVKRKSFFDEIHHERKNPHHDRRKSAPIVSWIRKDGDSTTSTTTAPQKGRETKATTAAPPAWLKQKDTPSSNSLAASHHPHFTNKNTEHVKNISWTRKNDGQEAISKPKSSPSTIFRSTKEVPAPEAASKGLNIKRISPTRTSFLKKPEKSSDAKGRPNPLPLSHLREIQEGGAGKISMTSPNTGLSGPGWAKASRLSPIKIIGTAKNELKESEESSSPHHLPLSDRVSIFEKGGSTKAAPQGSPKGTVGQGAKPTNYFWEVGECYRNPALKLHLVKDPKVCSLMNSMSLGEEEPDERSNSSIEELEQYFDEYHDALKRSEKYFDECHDALERSASLDHSTVVLEYGDANFSFPDVYQGGGEKSDCRVDYDCVSEGSTYKVDNYQKDFNAVIPIQSPWSHPVTPSELFEFEDNCSEEIGNMTIVSLARSESKPEPITDHSELIPFSSGLQESTREERPPIDPSSATRRTHHHQVSRCSLLSSTAAQTFSCGERDTSEEVDPIFQVNDFESENKTTRGFISFLSKSPASEQEESKLSKGVFKILKKGLSSSSSKKDTNSTRYEDVTEVVTDEVNYEAIDDDMCSNTKSTISSITRSVASNSGDASQKSLEAKPTMPLGVFNGFFKAARKLQKKRKKISRGRSLSNVPLPADRRTFNAKKPAKPVAAPPSEVQLWPTTTMTTTCTTNSQFPMPETAVVARPPVFRTDRRFGAYGGLASSRSKALDVSSMALQSLASW